MNVNPDPRLLIDLAHAKMYFGKFKGWYISDLPESYLTWFGRQGFPPGKLGDQLKQVQDLKVNGMEGLLKTIRKKFPPESGTRRGSKP